MSYMITINNHTHDAFDVFDVFGKTDWFQHYFKKPILHNEHDAFGKTDWFKNYFQKQIFQDKYNNLLNYLIANNIEHQSYLMEINKKIFSELQKEKCDDNKTARLLSILNLILIDMELTKKINTNTGHNSGHEASLTSTTPISNIKVTILFIRINQILKQLFFLASKYIERNKVNKRLKKNVAAYNKRYDIDKLHYSKIKKLTSKNNYKLNSLTATVHTFSLAIIALEVSCYTDIAISKLHREKSLSAYSILGPIAILSQAIYSSGFILLATYKLFKNKPQKAKSLLQISKDDALINFILESMDRLSKTWIGEKIGIKPISEKTALSISLFFKIISNILKITLSIMLLTNPQFIATKVAFDLTIAIMSLDILSELNLYIDIFKSAYDFFNEVINKLGIQKKSPYKSIFLVGVIAFSAGLITSFGFLASKFIKKQPIFTIINITTALILTLSSIIPGAYQSIKSIMKPLDQLEQEISIKDNNHNNKSSNEINLNRHHSAWGLNDGEIESQNTTEETALLKEY
jgi:hypothetical protein